MILTTWRLAVSKDVPGYPSVPQLDLPAALLFLAAILSTLFSVNSNTSLFGPYYRQIGLITYAYLFLIYVYLPFVLNNQKVAILTKVLKVIGLVICIYSLFQFAGFDPLNIQPKNSIRPVTTMGNAIFTAGLYLFIFPFALTDLLNRKETGYNLFICILLAGGILVSQTRAGYIAMLIQIIVTVTLFYLIKAEGIKAKRKVIIILISSFCLFVFSIILIILLVPGNVFVKRLLSISEFTYSSRYHLWKDSVEIWKAYPLFGTGIGCFANATDDFISAKTKVFEISKIFDNAHSNYLQTACTMGLLGIAAYAALLFQYLRLSYRGFISEKHNKERTFYLALFSTGVAYVVFGIADFDDITIMLYFISMAALLKYKLTGSVNTKSFRINHKAAWILLFVITLASVFNSIDNIKKIIADRYFRLGKELYAQQNFKESVNNTNKAIYNYTNCPDYKYALTYFIYDYCSNNTEKLMPETKTNLLSQAKDELKRCEINFPSKLRTKAMMSLLCYENGEESEGNRLRDEVLSKDTLMIDYSWELTRHFFRSRRYSEMLRFLETTYRYNVQSEDLLQNIIKNLAAAGEYDAAIRCCQMALGIRPENEPVRRELESILRSRNK